MASLGWGRSVAGEMEDLVLLALTIALFGLLFGLLAGLDRI
jgi:hypothetical protein